MSQSLLRAVAQPVDYERTAQIIRVPTPAAGAQWSQTVPGDQAWLVRAVAATFVASAAVANRSPALLADDQSTTFLGAALNAAITAGLTVTLSWARGLTSSSTVAAGSVASAGLPDLVLPPGYRLRSTVAAMDAADQWSSIALYVESLQVLPFGTREEREAMTLARYLAPYLDHEEM